MSEQFSIDDLLGHPFAIYTQQSVEARDQVVDEITRLRLIVSDASLDEDERKDANKDLPELVSALGLMDEADRAFIARVVLGPFPPKEDVVARTIELNQNLAQVVVDANRAQAVIRLVTQWADALRAVVTGQVAAMPAVAAPASAPATAPAPAAAAPAV